MKGGGGLIVPLKLVDWPLLVPGAKPIFEPGSMYKTYVYRNPSISTINAFQKSAVLRKFVLKEGRKAW